MYSDSIKKYLITTSVNKKISRSGKFTGPFQDFYLFCESTGVSLKDIGLLDYSLPQIKICILHDLLPPKCHCGKPTSYGLSKNKWVDMHKPKEHQSVGNPTKVTFETKLLKDSTSLLQDFRKLSGIK